MSSNKPSLNPSQFEAVHTLKGPLLVIAGAGSGKTRILTHRIANLIESGTAFPGEICALTFTNKTARVMKERVAQILANKGIPVDDILISTFHSLGAKLLRMYGGRIGLESGFTIYDDSDQLVLIKEAMEVLNISDKVISPKAILHRIGALKNDAINPLEFVPDRNNFFEAKMAPVIRLYEEGLRKNNAVDFGDLILRTYQLFKQDEAFRDRFQERYRFVLVDEYQDTNASQYKLLRLMTEKYRNLCVVGDEDQSIYGWRGADIRNILDFEKDFPEAKVVKLEENYRSTGFIIRAANKVIANNKQRKEKVLYTSLGDGDPVEVHHLENDFEEARFATRRIQELVQSGTDLREIAIFYRTNAQSRMFEDRLRYDRIPYKIFGGLKFYDRAEIKDALAYLKLFINVRDEVALSRIINVPTRGIGKTTLDFVKQFAQSERVSLFEAIGLCAKGESHLGSGPRKKLAAFLELFAKLQQKIGEYKPVEFYAYVLDEIGYLKALEAENSIEAEARLENLKELGTVLSEYEQRTPDATVEGFLEEVALVNEVEKDNDDPHFVSMMTVHSSKGLEFDTVFVGGMEEELFPHIKPDVYGETDKDGLEEERRLAYVAITRARQRLYLLTARTRRVFGVSQMRAPSRFLEELPKEEILVRDHAPRMVRPSFNRSRDDFGSDFGHGSFESGFGDSSPDPFGGAYEKPDGYTVGVVVSHPDFGHGTIVAREGQSEGLKVTVRFEKVGTKKFVVKYAPLEVVS